MATVLDSTVLNLSGGKSALFFNHLSPHEFVTLSFLIHHQKVWTRRLSEVWKGLSLTLQARNIRHEVRKLLRTSGGKLAL